MKNCVELGWGTIIKVSLEDQTSEYGGWSDLLIEIFQSADTSFSSKLDINSVKSDELIQLANLFIKLGFNLQKKEKARYEFVKAKKNLIKSK